MSQEITGQVHLIGEVQQITDTFKKREMILFVKNERNEEYSDFIPMELKQDKTDLTKDLNKGDTITVHYNPRGRVWHKDGVDRYFGSFEAWKIEKVESAPQYTTNELPPEFDSNPPF